MTKRLFFTASICLMLNGCGVMQKNITYDDKVASQQQQLREWPQQNTAVASKHNNLNDLLSSPQLDALVKKAYAHNPSLQSTLLTLQVRQSQLKQTRAASLPQVDFSFSGNKTESADTTYTSALSINWQADLWGKLSSANQAAQLDVAEQALLYQSARDTLTAEVMIAWLGLIAEQHAITIEENRLTTLEKNAQFIKQRYRNGISTLEDLDSARTAVSQSLANIASYKQSYRQQHRDLQTLVGDLSSIEFDHPHVYPEVILPLADLPEQTLARRPDLQAAYQAIKASELRTKVAYRDMLPSLDIGASLEQIANSPREALFTSPLWSLLAQLSMPIFHGHALKAAAKEAELETAISYQSYRKTLLNAVNEVQQALDLELTLQSQQTHIQAALNSEMNNLQQYEHRYRKGLVDILDLLNVQQQTYDLQAQHDNLIYQRLTNRIKLGLALGLGVPS